MDSVSPLVGQACAESVEVYLATVVNYDWTLPPCMHISVRYIPHPSQSKP